MNIPPKYEDVVAKLSLGREEAESTLGELEDLVEKLNNALGEIDSLQQRLTVEEQRLSQVEGACDLAISAMEVDERGANFVKIIQAIKVKAALKPAEEVEAIGARPVGCCCPPKGHTGIWAAAMCPVHFGLKRHGVSHDQ